MRIEYSTAAICQVALYCISKSGIALRERSRAPRLRAWAASVLLLPLLPACENFTPQPVNFGQEDIITVGDLHTIEIDGRVVSSLPANAQPVDSATVALGKVLFWDPILSGDRDVACATCHLPDKAYTDGLVQSIGVGGVGVGVDRVAGAIGTVKRNSQGLINTRWNGINELGVFDDLEAPMFWDNRLQSLELQALEPIRDHKEMRGDRFARDEIGAEVIRRLRAIDDYRILFEQAFGTTEITLSKLGQAIAAFEKTLIANNSAFDRWMRGDQAAMTETQLSALREFVVSGCADCHSGPMFSDFQLHVLGVADAPGLPEPDSGDGAFAFRTPTLRQLQFTAPYFHNGRFTRLIDAVEFYDDRTRSENPQVADSALDPELRDLAEMDDGRAEFIVRFLETLNDEGFDQVIPLSVPSGLPPGGL